MLIIRKKIMRNAVSDALYALLIMVLIVNHVLAQSQSDAQKVIKLFSMGTNIPPDDISKILSALPEQPLVKPKKPRMLLIFDLNVNYGGHRSAAYANMAFKMMGEKTGAFKAVISSDPSVFRKESLQNFDAVFFNNNVGNLFTNTDLRESLVEFVYGGKGMMGVHGTTVAFTKWPGAVEDWVEFGIMLGARGASHRENTELVTVKVDDVEHPLNKVFNGKSFEYRDEFFRYHEVYSRDKLRILLSIDTNKLDLSPGVTYGNTLRKDHDYAIAWVRQYGRGRVFHSTIAHNPYVFYDPMMLKFYLGAVQFILGDMYAPTTPSGKINEFNRLLEKLKWSAGIFYGSSTNLSIEECAQLASKSGFFEICIPYGTKIFKQGNFRFTIGISDDCKKQFRLMLDKNVVRVSSCVFNEPLTEEETLPVFEFLKIMGIESVILPANQANVEKILAPAEKNEIEIMVRKTGNAPIRTTKFQPTLPETAGLVLSVNQKNFTKSLDLLSSEKSSIKAVLISEDFCENLENVEKFLNRFINLEIKNFKIWFDCNKINAEELSTRIFRTH